MKQEDPINAVARELDIVPTNEQAGLNRELLAIKINELISTNFQKLIAILYRMDVSETKLRSMLADNAGSDAGLIIAGLMIDRQVQKIKSREQFSQRDNNIDENEKW